MKSKRTLIASLIILVIAVSALYRVFPGRPFGFAPQLAIAFFAGMVIKDRKWAFILPVLSMFISDLLYQGLFTASISDMQGFYVGQWQNYLLFAGLVSIGFLFKKINLVNIATGSLATAVIYFLVSNFIVWSGWQGTRGWGRPMTWDGLVACYVDGIPFFWTSLASTLVFSALFFGTYALLNRRSVQFRAV